MRRPTSAAESVLIIPYIDDQPPLAAGHGGRALRKTPCVPGLAWPDQNSPFKKIAKRLVAGAGCAGLGTDGAGWVSLAGAKSITKRTGPKGRLPKALLSIMSWAGPRCC